ncbi:hypothetical protein Tsubulata_014248 [Turnera subulata]|uniref:Uncharacterized protein n=1 Tax=Turnera subulata TaxID=218843 RepID=A0A9Q0G286_9ROSI|nr:hypothetical protein Tsubulata_014248 [Turnera subulata]
MEIDGGGGGVFLLLTKQPTFPTTKLARHNPLFLRLCKFKTTHDNKHYSFCSRHCSNYYYYYNNTLTRSGKSYLGIIGTVTSTVRCGRWDANAEASGPRRFKFKYRDKNRTGSSRNDGVDGGQGSFTRRRKRKWLSSDPPRREAQEEIGFWDEVIDGLWILKVFRSYGLTLVPIIISLILATGLGAFLAVFTICLGLSALIYAIDKLLGRRQSEPKRNVRRKERPSSRTSPYTWVDDKEEQEEEEEGEEEWENMGYQSWVVDENGSVSKDGENAPQFGGWDDIDGLGSVPRPAHTSGRQRKTPSENGKLSETGRESGMFTKTGRESDTPLLLRLLIAVFPFLGSWTKMFW